MLLFEPAYMEYGYTGTTHGTPYGYDTLYRVVLWLAYTSWNKL
ncbi:MAG: hypothetical protein R2771_13175 [Saprospiraceae bacterium]